MKKTESLEECVFGNTGKMIPNFENRMKAEIDPTKLHKKFCVERIRYYNSTVMQGDIFITKKLQVYKVDDELNSCESFEKLAEHIWKEYNRDFFVRHYRQDEYDNWILMMQCECDLEMTGSYHSDINPDYEDEIGFSVFYFNPFHWERSAPIEYRVLKENSQPIENEIDEEMEEGHFESELVEPFEVGVSYETLNGSIVKCVYTQFDDGVFNVVKGGSDIEGEYGCTENFLFFASYGLDGAYDSGDSMFYNPVHPLNIVRIHKKKKKSKPKKIVKKRSKL